MKLAQEAIQKNIKKPLMIQLAAFNLLLKQRREYYRMKETLGR
jgi:hypothetical protein